MLLAGDDLRHDPDDLSRTAGHRLVEPAHPLGVEGGAQQQHGFHFLPFVRHHLRAALEHGTAVRGGKGIGDQRGGGHRRDADRRTVLQQLPAFTGAGAVEVQRLIYLIAHHVDGGGIRRAVRARHGHRGVYRLLQHLPRKGFVPFTFFSAHGKLLLDYDSSIVRQRPPFVKKKSRPADGSLRLAGNHFLHSAFTLSKVATVSASGLAVNRDTTTMKTSATMKAGSSS